MGRYALDLAWAGGYLDGEGHFSSRNGRSSIEAASTNPASLYRLEALFGGRVSFHARPGDKARDYWRWRIFGDDARQAATQVLPHLVLKGPEAEAVIALGNFPKGSQAREVMVRRALQHRHQEYTGGSDRGSGWRRGQQAGTVRGDPSNRCNEAHGA